MFAKESKKVIRAKRHLRVRKKINGTAESPRLSVFISLTNIYLQLIDDLKGTTLLAVSTQSKEYKENYNTKSPNIQTAINLGKLFGQKAKDIKIESLKFDRNGRKYHGKIKALAEAIRESGIKF